MGHKIVVGPIDRGLRTDRTAFVIDNDSFPTLVNAYQWRGRVKRKRGTSLLTRLSRFLGITNGAGNLVVTIAPTPIPTGISSFTVGADFFVDPGGASPVNLLTNGLGTGVLNRATGVLTITGSQINTAVLFFPTLPVLGLESLTLSPTQFPGELAFDQTYSYNVSTAFPYTTNDVSFYKNPPADATNLPGYVPKATWTPTWWNGQDYQQFWSTNYQGALWVTNGINVPFSITSIGMQYNFISAIGGIVAGPPALATITTTVNHGLVVGDFVFINEVVGVTGINLQTGYVTAVPAANQITVEFPFATLGGAWVSGGIVQFLTSRSDTTKDCLRWYDGDPTNGNSTNPIFVQGSGWVNFAPPLSRLAYSIADLPQAQYYLVGARVILQFQDRLLFFGPVVQTSAAGSQKYLQDTVIFSQNGTPYYTASFTYNAAAPDDPTLADIVFHPILVPVNQTASPAAYFEDETGFGGFRSSGLDQPILTVNSQQDVLIVGHSETQTRLIATGDDFQPFNFYLINSELGSGSTFSVINMDQGVMTRGQRGYLITSQTNCQRIDLDIPDQVFQINLTTNGNERFTAQRDFINEWVYFTYPSNEKVSNSTQLVYKFPNQTLQYNYRDNSWAVFNEAYTTYGSFLKQTGFTWATVGTVYETWSEWNDAWDTGVSTLLQPQVIAGNQQGFIMVRENGTGEGTSLTIQNISGNIVTSPNHTLNLGDYIIISGVLGTSGTEVNNKIFSVSSPLTTNSFGLNPVIVGGTYLGGGLITRMYVPQIQTKQFPVAWEMGRKTRLGPQLYLLTTTPKAQIQLLIFLSQNSANAFNNSAVIPDVNTINSSLVYSTVLYTCPESTNLGLTPANTNLQMIVMPETGITGQQQMWHRVNTSLIGDTVQVGFTMSDKQMRAEAIVLTFSITGASRANPCVLTSSTTLFVGEVINITGVVGMTELNDNTYEVLAITGTTVTIDVDSRSFNQYISGGTITTEKLPNQFSEIELHGMILDCSPSSILA